MLDIVGASREIAARLIEWTDGMEPEAAAARVYNEAIDDAINFVLVLATKNPKHRLAFYALVPEMRKWLPLKLEE